MTPLDPTDLHLDSLDDRVNRFDQQVYDRARERMTSAPASLDADDVEQLFIVSRSLAQQALDLRDAARTAQARDDEQSEALYREHIDQPVTGRLLQRVLEELFKESLGPLREDVDGLTTRVGALEGSEPAGFVAASATKPSVAKPHVVHRGIYDASRAYSPGDACLWNGSLWICRAHGAGLMEAGVPGWELVA